MGFLQGVACAPPATRFLVRLSCLPPGSGAADVVAADNARLPERLFFLLAPVYAPGQGSFI